MGNKKSILFSPIGTTDPIRSQADGAMLHIVRHIRPEVVWLFLTKEMAGYHDKDDRYRKSILRVMPKCRIEIIKTDIDNPQDFDACYLKFREAIKAMREKYADYELLVNISSGTAQMKSILAYEAVGGAFNAVAIQVNSPNRGANDKEEHLTSNFDIDLAFETNQDHVNPTSESRLVRPNFRAITAYNMAFKIGTMINSYNYSGALSLLKGNIDLFDEKLGIILEHGDLRTKFRYDESLSAINNELMKDYKEEIWFIHDRKALKFYEFFMTMKLRQKRGELSDMILKLTPFSFELAMYYLVDVLKYDLHKVAEEYNDNHFRLRKDLISGYDSELLIFLDKKYNGFKDCNLSLGTIVYLLEYLGAELNSDIYIKFRALREVERELRNKVAHQMIPVTEEKIMQLMKEREIKISATLPKNSGKIIELCGGLLRLIFKRKIRSCDFVYDKVNEIAKELML